MKIPFLHHTPTVAAPLVGRDGTSPDSRVGILLDICGYVPLISSENDYYVTIDYSGDRRSQLVYIGSWTDFVRGREWRMVWSQSFDVPGKLPWEQALALLDEANRPLIGSWYIVETGGRTLVGYKVMVPADCHSNELDIMVQTVAELADDLERATVGTDKN